MHVSKKEKKNYSDAVQHLKITSFIELILFYAYKNKHLYSHGSVVLKKL